jgi:geranylgeranyl diphosphate synthase type I
VSHPDLLRGRVQQALSGFLANQEELLATVGPELAQVGASISTFLLDGGKRLRPLFCYWGARGAGLADSPELVCAAASLELLQACALVHDDVMDGSATRRGRPSVHEEYAATHRSRALHGDADAFGRSAAILIGDLCLIWSDRMLDSSGISSEALARARAVHDVMRTELMAGQYLDVLEVALGGGSVDRALRVARFKTAKYTIERPLHLGAVLADAPPEVLQCYSAYGLPLGEAFQLRDDVLGVFGDPTETGKPAGDDLREGKRTALVALALQHGSPAAAQLLTRGLGDPMLGDEGVAQLRAVIVDSGALGAVEELIERRLQEALTALQAPPISPEATAVLRELALAATRRSL